MVAHAIQSPANASCASKFQHFYSLSLEHFKFSHSFSRLFSFPPFHRGNTEGWRCERCKSGYFGNPAKGCEPCRCDSTGSMNHICDSESGQCVCKANYAGHQCDECAVSRDISNERTMYTDFFFCTETNTFFPSFSPFI